MRGALTAVPEAFPVWVASACCDADTFADFVKGGHAREVSPQFFTWREGMEASPAGSYRFKPGMVVHSLLAVDHAGRRIALSDGRTPVAWADVRKCIADWDLVRLAAGIKAFSVPYLEAWRK